MLDVSVADTFSFMFVFKTYRGVCTCPLPWSHWQYYSWPCYPIWMLPPAPKLRSKPQVLVLHLMLMGWCRYMQMERLCVYGCLHEWFSATRTLHKSSFFEDIHINTWIFGEWHQLQSQNKLIRFGAAALLAGNWNRFWILWNRSQGPWGCLNWDTRSQIPPTPCPTMGAG